MLAVDNVEHCVGHWELIFVRWGFAI